MNKHPAVRKTKAPSKPTPASVVARAKAVAKSSASSPATKRERPRPDGDARRMMIAEAAYFRSEHRGFTGGSELDDWLEAEREIARMLDL